MGKSRARIERVTAARGSWAICSLALASILLAGCNQTSATDPSSAASAASSSAAQSVSGNPAPSDDKSADVSWTPPTTNTNGSALTDLAGYRIYYGTSPDTLNQTVDVPNAGATDYVIDGLTQGTWYFAVAAYTNAGLQSGLSSIASKTIS